MINLVSDLVDVHCLYQRERGQIRFRWIVLTPEAKTFKSNWLSLFEAKTVDQHLLREFTSRFSAWTIQRDRELHATNSYLQNFKEAVLAGEPFNPPAYWAELHRAYVPYAASQRALSVDLKASHPSAEFCAVQPSETEQTGRFFALCLNRLWSSSHWVAPSAWIKHARDQFPTPGREIKTDERAIEADVKREVWRRDQGRCTRCGSRERLEFDHIIPFSKGGASTARNIELLCERCNRSKGADI